MLRTLSLGLAALLSSAGLWAAEPLNFRSVPLTAGKVLLTENGYWFNRELGIANFSPELRLPVQLTYNLTSEEERMLGFGWNIPQLESSAFPQRDGVIWTTLWGEKIRFYASGR